MVILQFIMGFIMGIYLMEILNGHLATKNILIALKKEPPLQKSEEINPKTTFQGKLG